MIYLAIDTDVWLWLICHKIDAEDNYFDELYYWIETCNVRCIVPQHILTEWKRNKQSKITYIKQELGKANQLSRDIIKNPEFFNTIYNAASFEEFGKSRVNKVEKIFTDYADIAPINDEIKLKASERTLARIAPNHQKDSYSDTVNILSLIAYIEENSLNNVIFTTKNYKDYSEPGNKLQLHEHLRELFEKCTLEYFPDTDYLFGKRLRPILPSFSEHLAGKKEAELREKLNTQKQALNKLVNPDQDFIGNSLTIDHILEQIRPTQFQLRTVKELIEKDEHCREYFFQKISDSSWFTFLKTNEYLDPNAHPAEVKTPEGTYLSRWQVLPYLERISEKIGDIQDLEMIEPLLEFATTVLASKIDNDLTHAAIIRILSNLPQDSISIKLIKQILTWMNGSSNKILLTSALCKSLLPRFLEKKVGSSNVEKAEEIIAYLLGISNTTVRIDHAIKKGESRYYSNIDHHLLIDTFIEKNLIDSVAELCSATLFYRLAATLKTLLLDYPEGLHLRIKVASIVLTVKVFIELPNLLLSLTLPDRSEEFCNETIYNYDQFTEETLKQELLSVIGRFGIKYENIQENEDMLTGLIFALTVDKLSMAGAMAINEMQRRSYHTSRMSETYGLLLSKYLDSIFRNNPSLGREISERLFDDHRYRLPFFRRVVLHNISIHFKEYKGLFAELIEPNDPHHLFTGYTYRTELFNLLKSNQKELNSKEVLLLEKIIAQGPRDEREIDEDRLTYWQAPWLLALNQRKPFDHLYATVKKRHALKDWDIDPNRTITLKNGSVPPMSSEQLLNMEDSDLVVYLITFNPKNRWEEPNISGLARILEEAVALNPRKFINAILLYLPVPYIYIHYVLYALLEYGKKNKDDFDWASVIRFTLTYISQKDFESEVRFLKQDSWHANKNWICSVASVLVSEVCLYDDYVKAHQLLPICRQIIIKVDQHVEISDFSVHSNYDYLSKSFNSDSGKLLRACIDYSLCRARLTNVESPDWEEDIIGIFNRFIVGGDSDSYTLLGCYWPQLNYLQPTWLDTQITELIQLPQPQWTAFMGGLVSSSAPGTMEKLDLFLPHYHRGIDTHLRLKNLGYNGFATHLISLFFWQLDNIKEDSLIVRYLSNMPMEAIRDLLNAIWFNEEYLASLTIEERQQLEARVITLIQHIHKTYRDSADTEVLEMRQSTVNIVYFIAELKEENTEMIRIAILLRTKPYHNSNLLKKLHELMSKGDHQKSAQHLASILEIMRFREHPLEDDHQQLEAMIQFLFDHNQIEIASKLCNRLSRSNYAFAKTLYLKNTAT